MYISYFEMPLPTSNDRARPRHRVHRTVNTLKYTVQEQGQVGAGTGTNCELILGAGGPKVVVAKLVPRYRTVFAGSGSGSWNVEEFSAPALPSLLRPGSYALWLGNAPTVPCIGTSPRCCMCRLTARDVFAEASIPKRRGSCTHGVRWARSAVV